MSEDDDIGEEPRTEPREEIARLETRIEQLAEDIERCRKIALFSKVLLASGALWLVAELFGILRLGAPGAIGSLTAILGGIVLTGSNGSTMRQAETALHTAEARRAELIGAIELRTVSGSVGAASATPWLH